MIIIKEIVTIIRYDKLLDHTSIENIEKAIQRSRTRNLGRSPKNLNDFHNCLEKSEWKEKLKINDTETLLVEFISNEEKTESILFIDKMLKDNIDDISLSTIFIDGTFATVPQIHEQNCQLWTILIRHRDRVSTKIFVTYLIVYL